ncbi:hypothetical protein ACTXT7_017636, partial [Hymenolepis weldensis]
MEVCCVAPPLPAAKTTTTGFFSAHATPGYTGQLGIGSGYVTPLGRKRHPGKKTPWEEGTLGRRQDGDSEDWQGLHKTGPTGAPSTQVLCRLSPLASGGRERPRTVHLGVGVRARAGRPGWLPTGGGRSRRRPPQGSGSGPSGDRAQQCVKSER